MEVIVKVNGIQANFLVDTGASLTILRPDIYYKIPEISRQLLNSTDVSVAMANRELVSCLGRGELELQVDDSQKKIMTHDVYLADIEPEGILGYDFLQMNDCSLNLGKGEMQIGRQLVKCCVYRASELPKCTRVVVDQTVTIEARGETLLPGKLQYRDGNTRFGIVEPELRFVRNHKVMIAKTLIDVQQELVSIRILNLKDEPVIVYHDQGVVIALCEPIESDRIIQEKDNHRVAALQEQPVQVKQEILDHLTKLYETSGEKLNQEQKRQLSKVLTTFQDVFAQNSDDVGKTSVVKHEINTGVKRPVTQPARRTSDPSKKSGERTD